MKKKSQENLKGIINLAGNRDSTNCRQQLVSRFIPALKPLAIAYEYANVIPTTISIDTLLDCC
jgi:hypothetical protein